MTNLLRFKWQSLILAAFVAPLSLQSSDIVEENAALTAEERAMIETKSVRLLEMVVPDLKGLPDQSANPLKTVETVAGILSWGNLFDTRVIVALTELAPDQPVQPYTFPPHQLSFFVWKKGHWIYQQYLGNANNLHFHEHRGIYFLQASRQTGRYEGDDLSWIYDQKKGQLMETHFEDWGPFYLVGDYLVCTRGHERRAHDTSHLIYHYKDQQKEHLSREFMKMTVENGTSPFGIPIPESGNFGLSCPVFRKLLQSL